MKFSFLRKILLTEDLDLVGGKNKKFVEKFKDDFEEYTRKGEYQIRVCKQGEEVEVRDEKGLSNRVKANSNQFLVRDKDDPKHSELINQTTLADKYEPIDEHQEADAEGFKDYREIGIYFALQYSGEEIYIFTDWSTKQKLKEGDFYVKPAASANASGFVVPAAIFAEHFEKIQEGSPTQSDGG